MSQLPDRNELVRKAINDALPLLTDKQRAFLNRIHDNAPWKGLANCPDSELLATYELIRRTLP